MKESYLAKGMFTARVEVEVHANSFKEAIEEAEKVAYYKGKVPGNARFELYECARCLVADQPEENPPECKGTGPVYKVGGIAECRLFVPVCASSLVDAVQLAEQDFLKVGYLDGEVSFKPVSVERCVPGTEKDPLKNLVSRIKQSLCAEESKDQNDSKTEESESESPQDTTLIFDLDPDVLGNVFPDYFMQILDAACADEKPKECCCKRHCSEQEQQKIADKLVDIICNAPKDVGFFIQDTQF